MLQTTQELSAISGIFVPERNGREYALSLAQRDAVVATGGLAHLINTLRACTIHPGFEGNTKTLARELEEGARAPRVDGTVRAALVDLGFRNLMEPDQFEAVVGSGIVGPIVFEGENRPLISGDLTVYLSLP